MSRFLQSTVQFSTTNLLEATTSRRHLHCNPSINQTIIFIVYMLGQGMTYLVEVFHLLRLRWGDINGENQIFLLLQPVQLTRRQLKESEQRVESQKMQFRRLLFFISHHKPIRIIIIIITYLFLIFIILVYHLLSLSHHLLIIIYWYYIYLYFFNRGRYDPWGDIVVVEFIVWKVGPRPQSLKGKCQGKQQVWIVGWPLTGAERETPSPACLQWTPVYIIIVYHLLSLSYHLSSLFTDIVFIYIIIVYHLLSLSYLLFIIIIYWYYTYLYIY